MENGPDLPRRIGVYTVERELGAGGMGTVCPARSRGGRAVLANPVYPTPSSVTPRTNPLIAVLAAWNGAGSGESGVQPLAERGQVEVPSVRVLLRK
jgi:hypothetical protein